MHVAARMNHGKIEKRSPAKGRFKTQAFDCLNYSLQRAVESLCLLYTFSRKIFLDFTKVKPPPTGRRQTRWLFKSMAEEFISGL